MNKDGQLGGFFLEEGRSGLKRLKGCELGERQLGHASPDVELRINW